VFGITANSKKAAEAHIDGRGGDFCEASNDHNARGRNTLGQHCPRQINTFRARRKGVLPVP
jgi:hypothetical protein